MKIHYFINCPNQNIPYEARENIAAKNIGQITCGACKQRIMNELIKLDWSGFDIELQEWLNQIGERLNRHDMLELKAKGYIK